MKLLYIFLSLLFMVPFSYANTNAAILYKKNEITIWQKVLTTREKTDVKNAIMGAIKVINDNNAMAEQIKFFGEDTLYAPKSPKAAPILLMIFKKDNLFRVNLIRKNEEATWTEASIYFPYNRHSPIETKFAESDFTQEIGLTFDKLSEHTVQHSASNGMEAYETKEFTFNYHWTLNKKIKVIFKVRPEDVLKNEKFPSNFIDVNVYKEN